MPTISESQLSAWTSPAFNNEDERRRNTEGLIADAIRGHEFLSGLPVNVYAKGSYKNNTNVRRDSDVDVAVEYTGILLFDYGPKTNKDEVWAARGIQPYSGPLRDASGYFDIDRFKDSIGEAMAEAFGPAAVTRHNKVFTVRESSRSLAADVVPCTTHDDHWGPREYSRGIQLLADRPPQRSVINYPQQHYDNGVAKNEATSKRFKRVVRILKNLENQMVDEDAISVVPSYLIECLVYNCPVDAFAGATWADRTRAVLAHILLDTEELECERRWVEVNGAKWLFDANQRWTRQEAQQFAAAAWAYVRNS